MFAGVVALRCAENQTSRAWMSTGSNGSWKFTWHDLMEQDCEAIEEDDGADQDPYGYPAPPPFTPEAPHLPHIAWYSMKSLLRPSVRSSKYRDFRHYKKVEKMFRVVELRTFRHACPRVMLFLLLENSLYATFQRGAENSFAMRPWMAYENGSSQ